MTVMHTLFLNQVDSTNLEARRRWLTACKLHLSPAPFVVVAAQQSAGMGRSGRTWQSPAGGLWLSVGWPLRKSAETCAAAPLAVGLAAAEALQECCGLHCAIKWPNDLLVNEKKLRGFYANVNSAATHQ
ncbi:biotin--acetyl-CoA-carboxylase ligase [mine drainage metagenome]|uniref:Biotin--acetyl-CoA-carboxylase ligase n=1 Tax=mine drainage metagenome TaxID=410659 RepID=T1CVR6_9ZZZZ